MLLKSRATQSSTVQLFFAEAEFLDQLFGLNWALWAQNARAGYIRMSSNRALSLSRVRNEGAEENLATGIVGALLLGEPCLESRSLCIKLSEAFFDGFASHHLVLLINRLGFAQRFTSVDETGL